MKDSFLTYSSDILSNYFPTKDIIRYFIEFSNQFERDLKFTDTPRGIVIKKDVFKGNLMCFNDNEKFYILQNLSKKTPTIGRKDVERVILQMAKEYSDCNTIISPEEKLDYELIEQTKHWLQGFPHSLKLYNQAINNYGARAYERHILDDLRLSFELLLKEINSNEKSLENQKEDIGKVIKKSGGSKEYGNMFVKLIEYYTKYQNEHAKHNDKVIAIELEFIIELTSVFMRHIIRIC